MPSRVVVDDDEQIIADLQKAMRRLRARLATTTVYGTHDEFTVAATPETEYQLTYIPVSGTCAMYVNGLEQEEDTDYTVDYDTGEVSFDTALTTGDEIDFRYLITDWLVARSLPPEGDTIYDDFNRVSAINPASDGGTWTIDNVWDGSSFAVSSNQAIVNTVGSVKDHARRDTGIARVDVTFTIFRAAETSYDQIWFGQDLSGNGTGYFAQVRYGGGWRLYRVDNYTTWSITQIDPGWSTSAFASGQAVVRVTRNATTGDISVYHDDTLVGTVTDTTYLTGTWVGFGSTADNESAFDDFSAAATL